VNAAPGVLELMAVVMARELRDGEVVVMGAVPALPLAACRLAQALHAPMLSYIVGGSGTVNPVADGLPASSCDPRLAAAACTLALPDVVLLEGRGDVLDVFCAGGLQIDAYGNCNLVAVGDWERPALRGPGSVGLPFLSAVRRSVLYTTTHSPRTLVEQVDFVSGPGHRRAGEPVVQNGHGPSLLVTPLATLDFAPDSGRMRLRTVHPGVEVPQVLEATGFELAPVAVDETVPPTTAELTALRRIDTHGILKEG
jgi:glutaconate CoA-transferase, subunit B